MALKTSAKMVVYTNKRICPGNIWWVFIIRVNTRANIIGQSDFGQDSLTHFYLTNLFALCKCKYFAVVSVTNSHCQRNIACGNLALLSGFLNFLKRCWRYLLKCAINGFDSMSLFSCIIWCFWSGCNMNWDNGNYGLSFLLITHKNNWTRLIRGKKKKRI